MEVIILNSSGLKKEKIEVGAYKTENTVSGSKISAYRRIPLDSSHAYLLPDWHCSHVVIPLHTTQSKFPSNSKKCNITCIINQYFSKFLSRSNVLLTSIKFTVTPEVLIL